MKKIMVLAFALSSGYVFAAPTAMVLSPYWDSVKKVEAVLNSKELSEKVSGSITTVRQTGALTYEVTTESCTAAVSLKAHNPKHPGPTSYTAKVEKTGCNPAK